MLSSSSTTTSTNLINASVCKDFVLAISSFCLAFGIVLTQQDVTHVSLNLGIFLITLGFVFFISLTTLFNKCFLNTSFGLNYVNRKSLKISECLDIGNKLISAIQAILSCVFGFLVCTHSCRKNFLTTSHIFSESYAWFASSYFLYDIWSMFVVYVTKIYDNLKLKEIEWKGVDANEDLMHMIPTKDNGQLHVFRRVSIENHAQKIPSFIDFIKRTKLMVFHHLFIGGYGLIVISSWRGGLGDCIFSFMYMMEASTPFVSFRAILSILGLKKTPFYIVNGLLMLLTFLVFRIIMLPVLLYKYSTIIQVSFITAILKLPIGCQLSILALFIPQFYWFFLMVKIAMKMFQPTKIENGSPILSNEVNHNNSFNKKEN